MDVIRNNFKLIDSSTNEKVILKCYADEEVKIAKVIFDVELSNCYIKTFSDSFQTHVVLYEDFCDFVYMIDTAFDELCERNRK